MAQRGTGACHFMTKNKITKYKLLVDSTEVLERAAVGFELSLFLSAVNCEVFNGGIETHSIAKGVSFLAVSLKHAGRILQEPDPIYSAQAGNTIREISHQSAAVFDELKSMLNNVQACDNGSSSNETLRDHFLRCFKKHRVTYLIAYMESLSLSLMAIGQIITLGKLLASKRYMEQDLATALIEQERAEIQNMLIIRCWSLNRIDRFYNLARREAEEGTISCTGSPATDPFIPEYQRNAFRKLRAISFGGVDTALKQIKKTPKDMVQVSAEAIDPLLQLWVRQKEVSWNPSSYLHHENCFELPCGLATPGSVDAETTENSEQPSQRARIYADDLRQSNAKYWATVQTDSENEPEGDEGLPKNVADPSSSSPHNCPSANDSNARGRSNLQGDVSYITPHAHPSPQAENQGNVRLQTFAPQRTSTGPFDNRDTYKIPVHDFKGSSPNLPSNTDTWKIPYNVNQPPEQHPRRPNYPPTATSYFYPNCYPNYPINPPCRSNSYPPGPYPRQHARSYLRDSQTPLHMAQTPSRTTSHAAPSNYDARVCRSKPRVSFVEDQYSDSSSSETDRDRLRRGARMKERRRQRANGRDKRSNSRTKSLRRSTLHGVLGAGAITAFLQALEGLSPGDWSLFMKY
ncbi:hypothetical protein MGYG_06121 [Nannizzia gypsea CBS 118893]|uniref:Uncharacterized protein n=1 Tax=Arthroderma gypseum (strain ATCC MYA-4604 / CBS 118893) TaxID=535722 RepID=E4V0J0_ARTGP|nr:hypothetical protein MGYG_06121 [Nannizzia gypsea CBS 118893]EFR03127.1 hypothetical protein MGYG_06121 [Nannizzia gypsea CBS 118893]